MASTASSIVRPERWGNLTYDRVRHAFAFTEERPRSSEPYASSPVVLNVVITRQCNMSCRYCVARDFNGIEESDLVISDDLIQWLKASPFMLFVLTGGEPLMPPYDRATFRIIDELDSRALAIDTNGTMLPSPERLSKLAENRVMIRVSLDSMRPDEEIAVRRVARGGGAGSESAYFSKLDNIARMVDAGVVTAIQTVVWRKNIKRQLQMIDWMAELGIKRWYLQRLIPSGKFQPSVRSALAVDEYYSAVETLASEAAKVGIECVAKRDLRHNSVFLLTADGALYTQGPAPGQKVRIGSIREPVDYFDYVSSADHACRYYLAEAPSREQV